MQEIYQKLKIKIIGLLLHLANAESFCRSSFYELKSDLLNRFGTYEGIDTQYIERPCWSCDGTGRFSPGGSAPSRICWNCDDGVYCRFNVELWRFRLGGFEFHFPFRRRPANKDKANIIGYIKHEPYPFHLGYEAELWLYLLFDREKFKQSFATFDFPFFDRVKPRVITPLLFASILVFRVKHTLSRKMRELKKADRWFYARHR
jgi:hypothetical protein